MSTQPFFIEQFVDTGLGNSAYLVGSHITKQAILIDALRDVDRYLASAERLGVTITHVVDTHLHADFVSGAREIAARTGAIIGASRAAQAGFDHRPLVEGDELSLGNFSLRIMDTPGHTPEHIAFLAIADSTPAALFSGGALIVGGAARTDLISHEMSQPLARHLYHTLHNKIMQLPDAVSVYPTHGAGSFCVAPSSNERTTTIGRERQWNALAQPQTEAEFVARALTGLPSYPVYYQHMRAINQRGPALLGGVPTLQPLAPEEVVALRERGAVVLDVRQWLAYARGHIPGSYGIPLETPLITWAGWLVPFGAQIILLARSTEERLEAVRQLIRIGYDALLGYLEGGVEAWSKAGYKVETVPVIPIEETRERLKSNDALVVLDVRQKDEWAAGHIPGAIHIENGRLPWDELTLPTDRPIIVQCQHGNRSMAGVSILRRRGYANTLFMRGGFAQWEEAGYEVERG